MSLPKKVSYIVLSLFFIFDNILSYFAITRMGGHEANLVIASYVEKYPLLYFLCIPIQILGLFIIMWLIKKYLPKNLKELFQNKNILEKTILTAFVIYWAVGNSSANFFFMIGLRHTALNNWTITSIVGVLLSLIYLALVIHKLHTEKIK